MPEARLDGCLQWSHLSSGHTGANRSVDFFRECFYSSLTLTELRSRLQTIVDACGCHASKQSDSMDRGLISSLAILYCANSLLYVDFIHGLPRFGGYDSCLVVTCGLSGLTRVFPCNKKITGEQCWSNNGSNPMGHLSRCTLMRMYTSAVTLGGTNEC